MKKKVLVAMSGGVDSSVAAALLLEDGCDVTGMFAVNFNDDIQTSVHATGSKCWLSDYHDALRVAAKLGISLLRWNFTKEYNIRVLDYMYKEYKSGRTPNPDVLCNKFIKFGVWMDRARRNGFDHLATGHYARLVPRISNFQFSISNKISDVKNQNESQVTSYRLQVSRDESKDQTYFLHQLTQKQLSRVSFPLGGYLKSEVRVLARKFGLPTAEKEESMGICFIGEVSMRGFLQKKIKIKKGEAVLSQTARSKEIDNGRQRNVDWVVGQHDGLAFYTIGERIGGRRSAGAGKKETSPLFVVGKDMDNNRLVIGHGDDPLLYKKEIGVSDVNWISGLAPRFPLECHVRLRHRQPLQNAEVRKLKSGIRIQFVMPQRAVTPGQFAVFYKDKECMGGGVIQ